MAKILIVEDEVIVLQSLETLLQAEGHEVIAISDSGLAENIIRNQKIDMLVTDIRMKPVDGMELLRFTGKLKPEVPKIVISAYSSEKIADQCYALGCLAYIRKPFKVEQVTDAIKAHLVTGK